MALVHGTITPIPDTKPEAVPDLWNTRYEEIDDNFADIDNRLESAESDIEGVDSDTQNSVMAGLLAAMDTAGLAMREVDRTRNVRLQEGEVTIYNRGVISGCTVSVSATTRNLDLAGGRPFAHGRGYSASTAEGAASVPPNTEDEDGVCYAYLLIDDDGSVACNCTDLNGKIPAAGIEIACLAIPSGNTEETDPNLAEVTITDTRRVEPLWPLAAQDAPVAYIELPYVLPDTDYAVLHEIVSCEGGRLQAGDIEIQDRLYNGFKILSSGSADAVKIRYRVSRLGI